MMREQFTAELDALFGLLQKLEASAAVSRGPRVSMMLACAKQAAADLLDIGQKLRPGKPAAQLPTVALKNLFDAVGFIDSACRDFGAATALSDSVLNMANGLLSAALAQVNAAQLRSKAGKTGGDASGKSRFANSKSRRVQEKLVSTDNRLSGPQAAIAAGVDLGERQAQRVKQKIKNGDKKR